MYLAFIFILSEARIQYIYINPDIPLITSKMITVFYYLAF